MVFVPSRLIIQREMASHLLPMIHPLKASIFKTAIHGKTSIIMAVSTKQYPGHVSIGSQLTFIFDAEQPQSIATATFNFDKLQP